MLFDHFICVYCILYTFKCCVRWNEVINSIHVQFLLACTSMYMNECLLKLQFCFSFFLVHVMLRRLWYFPIKWPNCHKLHTEIFFIKIILEKIWNIKETIFPVLFMAEISRNVFQIFSVLFWWKKISACIVYS